MPQKIAPFFVLLLVLPAQAANPKFDPKARALAVAPFLDDQTLAIAHVDLTRIDVKTIITKAAQLAKLNEENLAASMRELQDGLGSITKAGARELYVVISLADFPDHPGFFIFPLENGVDSKKLLQALEDSPLFAGVKFEERDQVILGGGDKTLQRLRSLKPVPRPEVARAFAAAENPTVQVLILPTDDSRRVAEEMMPTLPKELGGEPITVLTHGVSWAAMGWNAPPQMSFHLVIRSKDEDSAQSLGKFLARFLKLMAENKEARQVLPNLDKLVTTLTPMVEHDELELTLNETTLDSIFAPTMAHLVGAASNQRSMNNLKQIGLAMFNYLDTYNTFPTLAIYDKGGKPLLSWRVLILPFLDEEKLYKEFHLDEPWDSEHNKKLIPRIPKVYQSTLPGLELGKTPYQGEVGENTMFPGSKGLKISDVPDGTSNTIFVVETAPEHAIPWTSPDDSKFNPDKPLTGLLGPPRTNFLALFVDGSVRLLPITIDPKNLGNLFTRNDGQVVTIP